MPAPTRLAEVLGALSTATDLADGYRTEQAMRSTVLAVAIARAHGLDDAVAADIYWATLLRFLGCTAFAPEETFYGAGDDIGLRRVMGEVDGGNPAASLPTVLRGVGAGRPLGGRVRGVTGMLRPDAAIRHHAAQCEAGQHLGGLLGLGDGIVVALGEVFTRWDGQGFPAGIAGEEISVVSRVVAVAEQVALAVDRHGPDAACEMVADRSGGWFDPGIVDTLLRECREDLVGLAPGAGSIWERFLEAEPGAPARLTDAGLDRACGAFAHYADLKSTSRLGHSTAVATLVDSAMSEAGATAEETATARRAAALHDLGVVGVPNFVWDKPGPLNSAEWDQVRMHSYLTDRILRRAGVLEPIAGVAGSAHERPDSRGYHRAVAAGALPVGARVLAAADAFIALTSDRPHRPAFDTTVAADRLCRAAERRELDADAVDAVLAAVPGLPQRSPRSNPAGLTDREVEVAVAVARGATNKDVARQLGITPKTAAHHVAHIYAKTGLNSRAGLALFVVESGLI